MSKEACKVVIYLTQIQVLEVWAVQPSVHSQICCYHGGLLEGMWRINAGMLPIDQSELKRTQNRHLLLWIGWFISHNIQSVQTKFIDQVEMQTTLENIGKQVHNSVLLFKPVVCMNNRMSVCGTCTDLWCYELTMQHAVSYLSDMESMFHLCLL